MPDKNGKLTAKEKRKVEASIEQHWKISKCPICNEAHWDLVDHLLQLYVYIPPPSKESRRFVPYLLATCTSCGYTILFNAKKLGILLQEYNNTKGSKNKEAKNGQK